MGELRKSTVRDAIDRCERVALYACLPICRTVSTAAMQTILGELPWKFKALDLGVRYRKAREVPLPWNLPIDDNKITGMSKNEIKRYTSGKLLDLWRNEWANSHKGRTTYKFIPNRSITKQLKWFHPTLEQLCIITGHGTLNKYLKDRNITDQAKCSCSSEEDWSHVLLDCLLYTDVRSWDDNLRHNIAQFLENKIIYEKFSAFCECVFSRKKEALVV